jgi:hypothetical protein
MMIKAMSKKVKAKIRKILQNKVKKKKKINHQNHKKIKKEDRNKKKKLAGQKLFAKVQNSLQSHIIKWQNRIVKIGIQ